MNLHRYVIACWAYSPQCVVSENNVRTKHLHQQHQHSHYCECSRLHCDVVYHSATWAWTSNWHVHFSHCYACSDEARFKYCCKLIMAPSIHRCKDSLMCCNLVFYFPHKTTTTTQPSKLRWLSSMHTHKLEAFTQPTSIQLILPLWFTWNCRHK